MEKSHILIILTGGTIMMQRETAGSLTSGNNSPLSELLKIFSEDFSFTYQQLFDIDSSNMQPEHWQELARCIYKNYREYDGFLILHGTDTMSYTAAALSFMLQNLKKPVIFTGSQLPLRDPASDGHNNVINALLLIRQAPWGVYIVFGNQVIRGTRAKKVSSFDLQAFTSVNENPVGIIGLSIKWSSGIPRPPVRGPVLLHDNLDNRVALLKIHPGFSPDLFDFCLQNNYRGIILESYGVGNVPSYFRSLPPLIKKAASQNVIVLVVSQCVSGSADLTIYETGQEALKAGAVSGWDMTPETAAVKLMWVLANFPESETRTVLQEEICGELGKS